MKKILITDGLVIDGTGAKAQEADILIAGDRIEAILPRKASLPRLTDVEVVSAAGALVTPGFIDAHAHSDAYLILEPDAPSKLAQGITTEVNGQCGGSVTPRYGEARLSSDWATLLGDRLTWHSLAEYHAVFDAARPSINSVPFTGHNTLRSSVIGYAARRATPEDLAQMARFLEVELEAGSHGLTTGLIYQPGKYSDAEEVTFLARVAARKGGMYATHMRSEGDAIEEAIDEVLTLVRATGIRAEISHLKTSGKRNWSKINRVLDTLSTAVDKGELLGSDRYPYCAAGTDLDVVFPDWAGEGGTPAECERLAEPTLRTRLIAEINASGRDWRDVRIGGTWSEVTKPYSGKTVDEIVAASREGSTPGEVICMILAADGCKTGAFFAGMSEENLHRIYEMPWIVPGSDASLRAPWGPLGADYPHPRAYGTMPRFYRLMTGRVADFAGILSREAAIARMTSLPAARFNLTGRGILKAGYYADIAIWREDDFCDEATYFKPHAFASGMDYVFVNGVCAYQKGTFMHAGSGRLI